MGGGTSHSRSPDGGECGIYGGVLVEMCTETPQSQRSIKIQNMLTEMLHPPASIVVRTRSFDLVRQLCGVPGHCLLEHPRLNGGGVGEVEWGIGVGMEWGR